MEAHNEATDDKPKVSEGFKEMMLWQFGHA